MMKVAHAKRLPVYLDDALALVVLDPVVVPDREELLVHTVLRSAVVTASTQESHRASSFLRSDLRPPYCTCAGPERPDGLGLGGGSVVWRARASSTSRAGTRSRLCAICSLLVRVGRVVVLGKRLRGCKRGVGAQLGLCRFCSRLLRLGSSQVAFRPRLLDFALRVVNRLVAVPTRARPALTSSRPCENVQP